MDENKCLGCGACEAIAPHIFNVKDGKSRPKVKVTEDKIVKEVEEACPVGAIKVTEVEEKKEE